MSGRITKVESERSCYKVRESSRVRKLEREWSC